MDLGISQSYIEKSHYSITPCGYKVPSNGEPRGRGVREGNKRSKYTNMIKKQRRVGEPESVDQREQLAVFGNLLDPSLLLTQHFALDLVDDKSRA